MTQQPRRAEDGPSTRNDRRARLLALASGAVLVAVVAVVPLLSGEDAPSPPDAPATIPVGADAGEVQTRDALAALTRSWARGDRAGLVADAADPSWAADTWRALAGLRVERLALDYVGADVPPARADIDVSAVVDATWRQPGWDQSVSTQLVVDIDDGAVVRFRPLLGSPVPLWACVPLRVLDLGAARLVLPPGGPAGNVARRLAAQVVAARTQVERVLPGTLGRETTRLVVVAPGGEPQFRAVLGDAGADWDAIAAVATSVDGSVASGVPDQVVLNPTVFRRLGPVGGAVVLGHEAAHVATAAAGSSAPAWVVEGFADFVALHDAGVPLRTAAGRTLALVRRTGPPGHLPGYPEFRTEAHGLGRAYEQAWLAFRMLESRYGTSATVRFARSAIDGHPVQLVLRDQLGTDLATVTAQWRHELSRLARVVG